MSHHEGCCGDGCRCEHHGRERHEQRDHDRGGPPDTEFLDLEISRVLYGEAKDIAREAARDLMREAIRERLRQRIGDRLRAVGVLVADQLADEVEANLAIEQRIEAQRSRTREVDRKLRELFGITDEGAEKPES
jgi:hypothetical protein